MMRSLHFCSTLIRSARWLPTAVMVMAVGLSGCTGWTLKDEGFRKNNDLSETARKARSVSEEKEKDKDKDINYWSFSEKGRQIERDLAPQ